MKKFIGGVVFGILVVPAVSYCANILETAANLVITKLSVVIARDAAEIEQEQEGAVLTPAIGFCAEEESMDDGEDI